VIPTLSNPIKSTRIHYTRPTTWSHTNRKVKKHPARGFCYKHHVFINNFGFHNHVAHHVLAAWALGASEDLIQAAYDVDSETQRAAFESPGRITKDNFREHLGNEKFYSAYLEYFVDQLQRTEARSVLEEHVFSLGFNFDGEDRNASSRQPGMLSRFLDSLIHPLIHTGYGFEFGLPGVIAEGAMGSSLGYQASQLKVSLKQLFINPPALFSVSPSAVSSSSPMHAFTVLAQMMDNPTIKPTRHPHHKMYQTTISRYADAILEYADKWAQFDSSDPEAVEQKVDELRWTNTLLSTIPGYHTRGQGRGKQFNADFYSMHLVTSSLFVLPLLAALSPKNKMLLLRTYFSVSLVWWLARGKTSNLDIEGLYAANPHPPSDKWPELIRHAVSHPDDHLVKVQRAMSHYSFLYGSRQSGAFEGTGLKGAERLDGTIFLRAALLTSERVEKGKSVMEYWDRNGAF
ncbi:hypothetical protein AAF712_013961, partial [Marasmius tenuissimus]